MLVRFFAFTILGPNPTVTISTNTLLANVAFELINRSGNSQTFSISNVIFVDNTGAQLRGISVGSNAVETVTNNPPRAAFSAVADPSLGPTAFTFDATASSDVDGTIPNPSGYFWDFGDGTQDYGASGPVLSHNFTAPAVYEVTLRVIDNLGATRSLRDSLGNVINNTQLSHASLLVRAGTPANQPPVASFTFTPAAPATGQMVQFDGSGSRDSDGFWFSGTGPLTTTQPSRATTHSLPMSTRRPLSTTSL